MHLALDADRIHAAIEAPDRRIGDRFPDAGLRRPARERVALSADVKSRVAGLYRARGHSNPETVLAADEPEGTGSGLSPQSCRELVPIGRSGPA